LALPGTIQKLFPIDDYQNIDAFVSQYAKSNIYFATATRNGKGDANASIVNIAGAWVNGIPRDKATELLDDFPLPPAFVVWDGNSYYALWKFNEPYNNIELIERINKGLAQHFGTNSNHNAAQFLRLPDTYNQKCQPARKVTLLTYNEGSIYEPDAFLRIGADTNSPDEGSPREEQQKPKIAIGQGLVEGNDSTEDSANDMEIENNVTSMDRQGEGTKFTIDRKIFSSDIWFDSPWKVKIWVYLIGNANHTDGHFMGIPIKRGQLIRSYRTIAKDCGYYIGYRFKKPSINTVRRICEDLTKDSRIVRRTVQPGTLFSICNYNSLQPFPKQRKVQRKVEQVNNTGTTPVHNKNVKKEKKDLYSSFPLFERFYKAYPKKQNKDKALKAWQKLNPDEELLEAILKALEVQKKTTQWQDPQFIPLPASWLNAKRWQDEIDPGEMQSEEEQDPWAYITNR